MARFSQRDHDQVEALTPMQFFQIGDKGEPLGVGGMRTVERPAEELDMLPDGESPAAVVPVGRLLSEQTFNVF